MAKVTKQYNWLVAAAFQKRNPITAKVVDVVMNDSDKLLLLDAEGEGLVQTSVYGKNWNTLIDDFGDDTDAWKGKRIQILRTVDPTSGKARNDIRKL